MEEEIDLILEETKAQMNKALEHLKNQFGKIHTGRASVSMLDSVMVDYYGSNTALNQVGNVLVTDPRTLTIQAWEKSMLDPIARAVQSANLGLNPQNNGDVIIISIPPLTEERRKDLAKQAKNEMEECKISIRNARKHANDMVKTLVKDGLSEDAGKGVEEEIQSLVSSYTARSEELLKTKEKDIMTI